MQVGDLFTLLFLQANYVFSRISVQIEMYLKLFWIGRILGSSGIQVI
jgi:hypothetical protein